MEAIDKFKELVATVDFSHVRDGVTAVTSVLIGLVIGALRSRFTLSRRVLIAITGLAGLVTLKTSYDNIILIYLATSAVSYFIIRALRNSRYVVPAAVVFQVLVSVVFDLAGVLGAREWSHRKAPFMVNLIHVHTFACAVRNARRVADCGDAETDNAGRRITKRQRHYAVSEAEFPSAAEFLSYCFFFPTVAFGPGYEYRDWSAMMDGPEAEAKMPVDPVNRRVQSHRPNWTQRSQWKTFISEVVIGGAAIFLWMKYPASVFSGEFLATPEALKVPYIVRAVFIPCVLRAAASFKYLFAWLFADASMTAAGFGHRDGRWGALRGIEPVSYFAPNFADMNIGWNTSVNIWLRYYIYEPLVDAHMPTIVTLAGPFTISALWHSTVEPFYLMTFVSAAAATQLARKCRGLFTPLERRLSRRLGRGRPAGLAVDALWYLTCWITTQCLYAYLTIPFTYRGSEPAWSALRNCRYLGYIMMVVGFAMPWGVLGKMFKVTRDEKTMLNAEPGWIVGPYLHERALLASSTEKNDTPADKPKTD